MVAGVGMHLPCKCVMNSIKHGWQSGDKTSVRQMHLGSHTHSLTVLTHFYLDLMNFKTTPSTRSGYDL